MNKKQVENLIAVFALVGMLCLFGSFLFDGATKIAVVMAAIFAFTGGVIIWLIQNRVISKQGVHGVLAAGLVLCLTGSMIFHSKAAFQFTETLLEKCLTVSASVKEDAASYSNSTVTVVGGTITITAKAYVANTDGCGDKEYQDTITVTVKNNLNVDVLYDLDSDVSGADTGTGKTLEPNGELTFTVKSGTKTSAEPVIRTVTFSNVTAVSTDADETTTFANKTRGDAGFEYTSTFGGTYTVDGNAISGSTPLTNKSSHTYKLVASPAEGYEFYGWFSKCSGMLDTDISIDYVAMEGNNDVVWPLFIKQGAAMFFVKDASPAFYYGYLEDAVAAAQESTSKTIVVANNGTLPEGNYTIPAGVTLLIPDNEANTVYTTEPATSAASSLTKPTAFRKLSMASGANIEVDGAISIGGTQHSAMAAGTPFGPVGFIQMNANSSITINSGAKLYAWGYITGTGSVTVKSGGQVYECFQIADWRGGSATSSMIGKSEKIFPMSQYYVQNVEVPMTLESGAREYGFMSVDVTLAGIQTTTVSFIGDGGMFQISGGSLTKDYDEANDRLIITLDNGSVSISPYTISVGAGSFGSNITINSSDYVLPITSNLTLNINSGSTVTLSQDVAFLPGSEVNIEEGGNCVVTNNSNIYVYDADEWDTYCGDENAKFVAIGYAPGQKKTRTEADLKDAAIKVNGTVDASAGYIYTTASGANIYSTGSGDVIQRAGTNTVTYQATYKKDGYTAHAIAVTPAQLKHGNGEYVPTESDTYNYINNFWHKSTCEDYKVVDAAVAPSCTETGLTEGSHCSVCNEVLVAQEVVDALGHSYNDGVVTSEPTCTEAGVKTYTCAACGETYTEEIAAKGHTEVVDAAVAPTCTETGLTEGKHCSVCGEVLVAQEEVAASGHVYGNDGKCTICGAVNPAEPALTGSIRLRSGALDLLDKVCIVYRASDDTIPTNAEDVAERGVLLYRTAEAAATRDPKQAFETVTLELDPDEERFVGYKGATEGIDARDMDLLQYAVGYLKLTDGRYVFGTKEGNAQTIAYSPQQYCKNQIKNSAVSEQVKNVCHALMNYGAAAQVVQYSKNSGLMNEEFQEIAFDESILGESVFSVDTDMVNQMKINSATMDLQGAITYIVRCSVDSSISDKQLYAEYTLMGKTYHVAFEADGDLLKATMEGLPAKDLDETLTVKPYYLDANGEKVYGKELVYSGYEYVRRALENAGFGDDVKTLAKNLATYIHYADLYSKS